MIIPIAAVIFYGIRFAIIVLVIEAVYLLLMAILYGSGFIIYNPESILLLQSTPAWITTSVALVAFSVMAIFSISKIEFVSNKALLLNSALTQIASHLIKMDHHSLPLLSAYLLTQAREIVESDEVSIFVTIEGQQNIYNCKKIEKFLPRIEETFILKRVPFMVISGSTVVVHLVKKR